MASRKITIYVVDDDASLCRALSLLLKSHGFKVETFTCAKDFMAAKHTKQLACLVLDVYLPDISGLSLQAEMTSLPFPMPIVFMSGHGDIPMSVKAIKGGAIDFLTKPFTDKKLLEAIGAAVQRRKEQNKEALEVSRIKSRIETLSPRELEVFILVAKGMLNKQIAYKRERSLQTIKVHRGRVMKKMKAKTVTELINMAQKAGLVQAR